MNDRSPLTEQLRADLDRLARRAPLENPYQPPLIRRSLELSHPSRGRKPTPRIIGAALLAAVLVVTVLIVTHTGTAHQIVITNRPPSPSSVPANAPTSTSPTTSTGTSPASGTTLPHLLPGNNANLQSINEEIAAKPRSTSGYPYAQEFEGPSRAATSRLLITTEVAPAGALADYGSSGGKAITVAGQAGYLLTLSTHLQLLWQDPSGVVVSLEAINIGAADLTSIATLIQVRPAADLGVNVTGPLPDGLIPGGSGSTGADGLAPSQVSNTLVGYQEDGCDAILEIVPGDPADYDAVAIDAGNGRSTTVNERPGLIIDWGATERNMVTVLWSYSPGVIARLQGDCSNIPALALQLHSVTNTAWDQAVASLGTKGKVGTVPPPPTTPATTPSASTPPSSGGYTFGLAH
jgi:hypothetical protein